MCEAVYRQRAHSSEDGAALDSVHVNISLKFARYHPDANLSAFVLLSTRFMWTRRRRGEIVITLCSLRRDNGDGSILSRPL